MSQDLSSDLAFLHIQTFIAALTKILFTLCALPLVIPSYIGALTYISAFSLSALHIYNLKYCQCKDENCCTND